jgi:cytosine/adenosine deaminase-related metal-dependent hydrolase
MAGDLTFEVTKAKINWGTFLQDMMRSGTTASRRFDNYSGRGPSVVAHNAQGEKRVLEVAKNLKDARERAATIEKDFRALSTEDWCERHDVPASFVSG